MEAVPPVTDPIRLRWRVTTLQLALFATTLAIVARLIGIGERPLRLDEAYSAWFSAQSWHALWTDVPTYETHPPFYYSLLKLWRDLAGGSAVALRLFSVLIAAATVPIVVAASGELERQHPSGRLPVRAGMAAFLVACSPMLALTGEEARPYPLLIFAYALAILGALRLMREFAVGSAGGPTSWLMLAVGTELGLWAHGLGLLYAFCLAVALAPAWLNWPTRSRIVRGTLAATAIALLYLPCLAMIMGRAGDWGRGWLGWEPAMALQLLGLYAVPPELLTVSSAVGALVIFLLAKRAVQAGFEPSGWNADRAILLLWWGPPVLAIVISQLVMPVFLTRTLTPTLVPAYLALAGALARVPSARERVVLAAALAIALIPLAGQIALRPSAEPWDEVAAFLDRNVKPGDEVWVYPNDSALPLHEAGATTSMRGIPGDYPAVAMSGPIRAGSPAVRSVTSRQAIAIVGDPHARGAPTIWLVTRQSGIFDPANDVPHALAKVRKPGRMQEWGYINVTPYIRR